MTSLTWTVFLPLFGAILLGIGAAATPNTKDSASRNNAFKVIAFVVTLLTFGLSLNFYLNYPSGVSEQVEWLPALGASYYLKLDGISIWLFLLTTFLMPICVLASWNSITTHKEKHDAYVSDADHEHGERGVSGFLMSLLVLETAMLGTFVAYDLLLFFIFWEMMLIPMYFLIGIWGSPGERHTFLFGRVSERVYATLKFVLYTMAGSALMLVGIIWLRLEAGSFNLDVITALAQTGGIARSAQFWLFWAFFIAFAIKVPMFPFHTWLPDAH
ncbi:MAG: proton-conducting transporter membrane subunit, partial [Candidatus Poribacteria bacterium]|nr:proton-conducting transporter membrane subunit [Candidatus Poribacteria bacterium]